MRGELDWIVMKALEKDRNRRYETANGLARDIEHYLHDEPVMARPPSAGYRFSKFAAPQQGRLAHRRTGRRGVGRRHHRQHVAGHPRHAGRKPGGRRD